MSLLDQTLALAAEISLTPEELKAEIGLTDRWLRKVMTGETTNPGVRNIEALHALLLRKKAQLGHQGEAA